MLDINLLGRNLGVADCQPPDITKVEFEVLDHGAVRWILWNGRRRLHTATVGHREDLVAALQVTGVVLRTMMIALQLEQAE